MSDTPRPLLRYPDVEETYGIDRRYLRKLVATRQIEHLKIGRCVFFRPEAVEDFLSTATRPAVR